MSSYKIELQEGWARKRIRGRSRYLPLRYTPRPRTHAHARSSLPRAPTKSRKYPHCHSHPPVSNNTHGQLQKNLANLPCPCLTVFTYRPQVTTYIVNPCLSINLVVWIIVCDVTSTLMSGFLLTRCFRGVHQIGADPGRAQGLRERWAMPPSAPKGTRRLRGGSSVAGVFFCVGEKGTDSCCSHVTQVLGLLRLRPRFSEG